MHARSRSPKVGLNVCLRRRSAVQTRIQMDEGEILSLPWRDIESTERGAEHVPSRVRLARESRFNTSEGRAETVHRDRALRAVRRRFKRPHEFVQFAFSEFERNERAEFLGIAKQIVEAGSRVGMREEQFALLSGKMHRRSSFLAWPSFERQCWSRESV